MRICEGAGTLIVCEGISGCGKSDSISGLKGHLSTLGVPVQVVEWNSNRAIRFLIKRLGSARLLNPYTYSLLQWLSFLLDYYRIIRPQLRQNAIVIADRYVYTGITRDEVNGAAAFPGRFFGKRVRTPDMVFFFDTNPQICLKRIRSRKKSLFHTNRSILRNRQLGDKELYYLRKLRKAYIQYFTRARTGEVTNLIRIQNNNCRLNTFVEQYLQQKLAEGKLETAVFQSFFERGEYYHAQQR